MRLEPTDAKAEVINKWKELGPIDILDYIEKNKFEKVETMILRKFEDGGWNYEGLFDKEGDDSSGFGRTIT